MTISREGGGAASGPLAGMTVLELGCYIAGPFAARLLADLGATVIKIETPDGGDPVRTWGEMQGGKSIWWSVHGRNKKSVTINVKTPEGRGLVLDLVKHARIIVENFKPGQIERWGIGPDEMVKANPTAVLVRISGYGQTGPIAQNPCFGVIGEAIGGLRHLTDQPPGTHELPPVRTGVSLGDSLAGVYAAMAALAAVHEQDNSESPVFRTVDVSLTESVLSLLEGCVPEYGLLGKIRQPTGSTLPTNAPSNAYPTKDGAWMLIAANSNPLWAKLAGLMGRPELADTPAYRTNVERVQNVRQLDAMIADWTRTIDSADLALRLEAAKIPSSKIYTVEDICSDAQYRARDMIAPVDDPNFGQVLHPGVVPVISGFDRRSAIRWPGPDLGAHTREVLQHLVGLSPESIAELEQQGVV
ncbi:CaiB/BaiF CoA-transferase family protein [Ancylobacter sp. WKF20]|uniref:CaiB/BaiF CoA transferase family protein n=1 Tax=Ancylobacter sp. WKF20 TaxID=3039801 RepID=UPI0024340E9F|nr:CaiB/BaiF CoA-transferase family protein [Ancylobacter sp. WKF20]WGD29659.1 CaiB/BaiF CoA-transferase family protein [Ancylobacter sp. WKF20]